MSLCSVNCWEWNAPNILLKCFSFYSIWLFFIFSFFLSLLPPSKPQQFSHEASLFFFLSLFSPPHTITNNGLTYQQLVDESTTLFNSQQCHHWNDHHTKQLPLTHLLFFCTLIHFISSWNVIESNVYTSCWLNNKQKIISSWTWTTNEIYLLTCLN